MHSIYTGEILISVYEVGSQPRSYFSCKFKKFFNTISWYNEQVELAIYFFAANLIYSLPWELSIKNTDRAKKYKKSMKN